MDWLPDDLRAQLVRHGHALLVGVSRYKNDAWPELPTVREQLAELSEGLKPHFATVTVLLDPSVSSLRGHLQKFFYERPDAEDNRLFVYYFGHGFTDTNYNTKADIGFLTGADTPPYDPRDGRAVSNSISMHEYDNMTRLSHARQILTVFDTCFSGTIFSAVAGPNIPTKLDLDRVRDALRRPVRYYITAGRANEKVPADFNLATLLLRGIAGDADFARDGFITGDELGIYLQKTVPNLIGRLITPQYGAVNDVDLSAGKFIFWRP
jgi:hypothetical protein